MQPQQAHEEICPHMKIISPTSNTKLLDEELLVSIRNNQLKCEFCDTVGYVIWICLHNSCAKMCCEDNKYGHLVQHYKDTKSNSMNEGHSLFINPFTTQIICIECKVEIFDFEQYCLTGNEEYFEKWTNPRRIREIFHKKQLDWENNLLKSNM